MRRTTSRFTITTAMALGLTALLVATAGAQPRLAIPEGATTDRFSADPWAASLDLGLTNFDGNPALDYAARVDMYGQILADVDMHRVGGYASLPFARVEGDNDASISKLGHLELGGLFTTPVGATTDILVRGGFAFEVSEAEEEDGLDFLALFIAGHGRLSEFVISIPETQWGRLSGSLLHSSYPYFARADLGVDFPFAEGDNDPIFRLNLAGGIDLESVALLAELVNVSSFADEGDEDDEILSTVAFTARIPVGTVSPVVSVVVPLDDALQDFVDFVVVVGVRATGGDGT